MTNLDIGTIGESEFLAKATRKGFRISKPCGTYPYDFIVDNGKTLNKVQVKTGTCYNKKAYSYTVSVKRKINKNDCQAYKSKDFDYLAAYVLPLDSWYIIPIAELVSVKGIALFPHIRYSDSKWEKYREAWGLLDD